MAARDCEILEIDGVAPGQVRPYREPWGVPMRVRGLDFFTGTARVTATPEGVSLPKPVRYDLDDFLRWYPA